MFVETNSMVHRTVQSVSAMNTVDNRLYIIFFILSFSNPTGTIEMQDVVGCNGNLRI